MQNIHATFYDGFGNELARPREEILLSIRDGRQQTVIRRFVKGPTVRIEAPFYNSLQDDHVILASMKRHRDAGFMPVRVTKGEDAPVKLMMLPREARFAFQKFADVAQDHRPLFDLFGRCFKDAGAVQFEILQGGHTRAPLACLLNIVEALGTFSLTGQKHPTLVDYIHGLEVRPELNWFRQDRFFAWVDADIEAAIRADGAFKKAPDALHPGARVSYKQDGFGEANVQITLHPEHQGQPGGLQLIKAEFDIDYFRDSTSHLLLEVFPNMVKRFAFGSGSSESLTDPAIVYGLRWIAARQPKAKPHTRAFAPAFGIQPLA